MREKGFFYTNSADMQNEFQMASEYFQTYPLVTKIRRSDWKRMYPNAQECPKHSYLNFQGHIIALATKARRRDADHRIGFGHFGAVKYGMDQYGKLYAIKIEKTNTQSQQTEERVNLDLNRMPVGKIVRVNEEGQTKYYSALDYLGDSMSQRLIYGPTWSLSQKKSIARKMAWQLHQLHAGKLSTTGVAYAHSDIKPDNITIDMKGRVHFIDFGFTELTTTPIETLSGSADYMPTIHAKKYHTALQNQEEATAEQYEQEILKTMQQLGRTGTDVFACKRTLYQSGKDLAQDACLFTEEDYQLLSPELREILKTGDENNAMDFQAAIQKNTTALDLTYALCKENLSFDLQTNVNTSEERYMICDMLALLDEVAAWEDVQTTEQLALVQDYERRILMAGNMKEIQRIHHELTEFNICLQLLSLIKDEKIAYYDSELQDWINQKSQVLYAGDYVVSDLKQELQMVLTQLQSEEMMAVKTQIAKWTYQIQHPNFLDRIIWGTDYIKHKIDEVTLAITQVPVEERYQVLTKSTHDAGKIIQKYCISYTPHEVTTQYKQRIQPPKNHVINPNDHFKP